MAWRPKWWLDLLKIYWPLNHWAAKATHWPVLGPLITWLADPFFKPKSFNISYIPVNAKIDPPLSTVLTQEIILDLIRKSAHRVVIKRCSCRDSKECKNFSTEDSCLLLGQDTEKISPNIANHLSVDEAIAHMQQKIGQGLIPLAGRVRMDDLYYGVPNHGRMLTICFCCPCCCTVLSSARFFPEKFRSSIVPLKGLHVVVDPQKCIRCEKCVESCFMHAISLRDGLIHHDESLCIGCGRCSVVCGQNAVTLTLEDGEAAVDDVLGRIRERVSVE